MKKVSFVIDKMYHNNLVFNKEKFVNIGAGLDKYHKLYDIFKERGYEIATDDINKPGSSNIVLYLDMPKILPQIDCGHKSYLLAIESSIIKPENFDASKHDFFNKIFTWNDDIVDDKKFIKINYSFLLPQTIHKKIHRNKLCCLIVSNKRSSFPNELYSERENIIRWFEKEYPLDFDLYGFGWNEFRFAGIKPIRALNRISVIRFIGNKLFAKKYSSYQGKVSSKIDTMKDYRFAIAYENVKDELGYITEKIFDVFMAGCVPVYWGARNITDYIPLNCFVDRRDFANNEELYEYMKNIDDAKYGDYLNNIESFLTSERSNQFSSIKFAKTIVDHCIGESKFSE